MDVRLSITSSDLDAEDIHDLSIDLSMTLIRETDVDAKLAERPTETGGKGEPITVGIIMLAFLTSGAAVSLLNVLKSYFERDSSLEMEFQREDGTKLRIRAENVRSDQIARTREFAREFLGDAE